MPLYTSGISGFSPQPIQGGAGTSTPTLIAQPFYRQLDSVSFDYIANAVQTDIGFFIDFIENGPVFNSVFLQQAVNAPHTVHGVFAQRIANQVLAIGSETFMQTALPVGIWVEPNVSVRLRAVNPDASDTWENVIMMLGKPEAEMPDALKR